MKKIIAILILLAIALPVRAEIGPNFDPVENTLLKKKMLEDDMSKDYQRSPDGPQPQTAGKSSNWWKWALGIVIVGGIAAAAGGGGGGGSSSGSTGSVAASW